MAQTVINTAGFQINDNNVWDGISPGLGNNLQGEMNGTETPAGNVLMPSAIQNPDDLITLDIHSPDLSDPNSGSPYSIHLQQLQEAPIVDIVNRPINDTTSETLDTPEPESQNPISGGQAAGIDNINPQIAAQLIEAIGSLPVNVIGKPSEMYPDQSNLTDILGEPVEMYPDQSILTDILGEPFEMYSDQSNLIEMAGKPFTKRPSKISFLDQIGKRLEHVTFNQKEFNNNPNSHTGVSKSG